MRISTCPNGQRIHNDAHPELGIGVGSARSPSWGNMRRALSEQWRDLFGRKSTECEQAAQAAGAIISLGVRTLELQHFL